MSPRQARPGVRASAHGRHLVVPALVFALLCARSPSAFARRDAEDLRRDIDSQRAAVVDFERLDTDRAVPDEITLLRTWLDEAQAQFAKEQYDRVREVLDRCIAQAELIRQKINAAKLTGQARERDTALKKLKEKIDRTKQQLQQATVTKKALEMNAK
jgi:hypothetical protein